MKTEKLYKVLTDVDRPVYRTGLNVAAHIVTTGAETTGTTTHAPSVGDFGFGGTYIRPGSEHHDSNTKYTVTGGISFCDLSNVLAHVGTGATIRSAALPSDAFVQDGKANMIVLGEEDALDDKETIDRLLAEGADIVAGDHHIFRWAKETRNADLLIRLLDAYANSDHETRNGTLLLSLVRGKETGYAKALLDRVRYNGFVLASAFHIALTTGNTIFLRCLVEQDITTEAASMMLGLLCSKAYDEYRDIFDTLFRLHASVCVADYNMSALKNKLGDIGFAELTGDWSNAVDVMDKERAFDALYEKASDALGNAVSGEHVDTVRVLLRRGAKVKLDHCSKASKEVFRLLRSKLGFHTITFCIREFLNGNLMALKKY